MAEGKGPIETLTEEGKAVAVEVYKDGGKPTVKAIGEALGSVARLLVAPVRLLADTGNLAIEKLQAKIAVKLSDVPADRLLSPPATIAGPAMLQAVLLGEGDDVEELRELFANLLATSMDRNTTARVHPSFVSILSQLTPDEAWLLKSIDRPDYAAFEVFEYLDGTEKRHLGTWSLLGRDLGIDEARLQQYVSNLDRIGILRIDDGSPTNGVEYKAVEKLVDDTFGPRNTMCHGGRILVTPLGQQFLDVCVRFKS